MTVKKLLSTIIILSAIFVLIVPSVSAAKTIKWKAQALWSAAELSYKTFVDFCERVKVLTNGRLEITPYPGGTIVPTFELLEAVQNNVLQAMHSWPGYYSGKEPGFAAISDLIAGYSDPWQKDAWMYYMGGWDMLNEMYKPYNVHSVGWMFWGIESMVSTKPIRRMEDFKGLKMRVPQGMTAMLMQKLGASVVVLPGGEVYSALDKGVIDASDWASPSMNQRMGFFQVAKYFNYPGFHSMPFADFAVNKDEWNKLPDDIKAILHTATREWAWDSLERIYVDDVRAIAEMKGKGVTALTWSEEDLAKVRAEARGIWDEFAKKSPMAKKVIDSQKDWLRKLGLIK
ncbi:MAG TPA: TRAP transporter substrate-binding protein [Desulfobacterales bacterium]|nr:TRAP transporter substrate-binding protein [Desulfobacterales bacterium]